MRWGCWRRRVWQLRNLIRSRVIRLSKCGLVSTAPPPDRRSDPPWTRWTLTSMWSTTSISPYIRHLCHIYSLEYIHQDTFYKYGDKQDLRSRLRPCSQFSCSTLIFQTDKAWSWSSFWRHCYVLTNGRSYNVARQKGKYTEPGRTLMGGFPKSWSVRKELH